MDNLIEGPKKISFLNKTTKHANNQNIREERDGMGKIKCNFS